MKGKSQLQKLFVDISGNLWVIVLCKIILNEQHPLRVVRDAVKRIFYRICVTRDSIYKKPRGFLNKYDVSCIFLGF